MRADGAAMPLHRSAPAGPGLVKKTLHSVFRVGFSLARAHAAEIWMSSCPGGEFGQTPLKKARAESASSSTSDAGELS
jgi:hypothetical protein